MRNWFAARWAAVKSWASRTASKVKAAALAVLAALGLSVGLAIADDVSLTWTNADQWSDGSTLLIEDLSGTEIWRQSFPLGTDLSTATRNYEQVTTVTPDVTSYVDANLPNGIHCYVAYHVATNGQRSDPSNEACKTVDTRLPVAPQGLSAN